MAVQWLEFLGIFKDELVAQIGSVLMNKVTVDGVELHDAEVVINTNQKPQTKDGTTPPPSGGGPGEGEEHVPH